MAPIREMLSSAGITEQQWRVLRVLDEHGPMDSSTVADRACLLYPSLTRITQSMSQKGLVTQTRDTADRRRQLIDITPKGRGVISDNLEHSNSIARKFREILGEKDHELLLDLLAKLDLQEKKR